MTGTIFQDVIMGRGMAPLGRVVSHLSPLAAKRWICISSWRVKLLMLVR